MLERNIVNSVQKWLKKTFPGCYLIKLESPSTSGILDLYFAWEGMSVWFEIKKPEYKNRTWKNKKIQEWHIKELNQQGILAGFFFSLDEVKTFMYPFLPPSIWSAKSIPEFNTIACMICYKLGTDKEIQDHKCPGYIGRTMRMNHVPTKNSS